MNRILILLLIALSVSGRVLPQSMINQRAKDGDRYLYLNFVVNSHDFTEPAQACKTLMRVAHIFNSHGVKADFYFVEQLITNIVQFYPWFPDSLKVLGMGVNLHHRAPHILSFKSSYISNLAKKPLDTLIYVLDSYEKYRLDLVTGSYNQAHSGGYNFVQEVFSEAPFTVSTGESGPTSNMGRADIIACKSMGARGLLLFHEDGSDADYPLFYSQGMLLRPVDFSITRWTAGSQTGDEFWWEKIGTPDEYHYAPARYLASKMASIDNSKLNFANAIIHETDFHYNLPPWRACYYSDSMSTVPYQAPFDTSRTAFWIRTNPGEHEERLWAYYDSLVSYAASNPYIKTYIMKDLPAMLAEDIERSVSAAQLYSLANTIVTANPSTFPPRFFTLGSDHFSVADAYHGFTRSLSEYFTKGSLPGAVTTADINGPFDSTVVNLSTTSQVDSVALKTGVLHCDSLFNHYAATNQFYSRIPSVIGVSDFPLMNPLEYLYVVASAYRNIYQTGTTGVVTPKSISFTNKQIYTNPAKWTEKPARRVAITGIKAENPPFPTVFEVSQNYPNPFNPATTFQLRLPPGEECSVAVYNAGGKLVRSEVVTPTAGEVKYTFDGAGAASGVYFFRFSAGESVVFRKSILIK